MFYYYGAKNMLARYYPAPEHPVIVEPFAGSASYSMFWLARKDDIRAHLIEKDPQVVALWHKVLALTPEKLAVYPVPPLGEQTDDRLLMTCTVSNASSKCATMKVTPRLLQVFEAQKRRILTLLPYKHRITVEQGDYLEAPDLPATWFVDPPYQVRRSLDKSPFLDGMGYGRDFCSDSLDFSSLGDWCLGRKGQTIVCEKEGADWLPFKALRRTKNSQGNRYHEVVWTSEAQG